MENSFKKIIVFVFVLMIISFGISVNAKVDRLSQEYLQSTNHFTLTKPFTELAVKRSIKAALKKETKANFDVKFQEVV